MVITEVERLVVDKLIKDGLVKFYIRYVDSTLVLVKVKDINNIMKQLNSFEKSIEFTIDRLEDGIVLVVVRQACIIKRLIPDNIVIFQV